MIDFIVPKIGDQKFVDFAREQNKDIVYLYDLKDYSTIIKTKLQGEIGIICNGNDAKKARSKSRIVVVKAKEDIRKIMEKNTDLFIYGMEFHSNKDFVHFRNSGLNQVLVSIADQRRHKFLFNFDDFLNLSDSKKGKVLGRLKQNLKMCEKVKVEYQICSFAKDKYGLKSDFVNFKRLIKLTKTDECNIVDLNINIQNI